jgi:hypothetical protein
VARRKQGHGKGSRSNGGFLWQAQKSVEQTGLLARGTPFLYREQPSALIERSYRLARIQLDDELFVHDGLHLFPRWDARDFAA